MLAERLGTVHGITFGWLCSLWEWVSEHRKDGGVSRQDLFVALKASGHNTLWEVDDVIEAMRNEGGEGRWLDDLPDGRYYIHDWHEHAEDWVHASLARSRKPFANGVIPSMRKLSQRERELAQAEFETAASGCEEQPKIIQRRPTAANGGQREPALNPEPLTLNPEPLPKRESERHTLRARDPDPPPAPILFEPPDAERVAVDFNQRGMAEADCLDEARRFLTYHQSLGWKDRHNRQYVDWTYPAIAWVDQWKKLKLRSRGSPRKRDQQAGPQDESNRRIREALNLNP